MSGLVVEDLRVAVGGRAVLRGVDLAVPRGALHALMGPNGCGKSTLARALAGHPAYDIVGGDIRLDGHSLVGLAPEERAHRGLFLGFQHPVEVPGVPNSTFLRAAVNAARRARGDDEVDTADFLVLARAAMASVGMDPGLLHRGLNEGFSGGERKRNEIVQMALLEPSCCVLDEPDSGLDVDARKDLSAALSLLRTAERCFVVISHDQRLLDALRPDAIHVLLDGRIARSGGRSLAGEVEAAGYGGTVDGSGAPQSGVA
jgi:Fe-S cluster assembly ATP-binding protein